MAGARLEMLGSAPEANTRNVQRALDDMRRRADGGTYTAANAAHWSGAAPTTIKDALDRIAAMIGPVP